MNLNNTFEELHQLKRSDSTDYFSFYDTEGNLIRNVTNISLSPMGKIETVTAISDTESLNTITYNSDQFTYTREVLYVLGIGYVIPGDIVKLHITDEQLYEINYGWHTNISNQTIYSWYLIPINTKLFETNKVVYKTDSNILTLYKDYLDTIEVVTFMKNRVTFNICK